MIFAFLQRYLQRCLLSLFGKQIPAPISPIIETEPTTQIIDDIQQPIRYVKSRINYKVLVCKILSNKQLQPNELTNYFWNVEYKSVRGILTKNKINRKSFILLFAVKKTIVIFIEQLNIYVANYNKLNKTNVKLSSIDIVNIVYAFRYVFNDIGNDFLRFGRRPRRQFLWEEMPHLLEEEIFDTLIFADKFKKIITSF